MKKKLVVTLFIFMLFPMFSGTAYAKKCRKCIEYNNKYKSCFVSVGIACRDFKADNIKKDGVVYGLYKCCYGHKYYDPL